MIRKVTTMLLPMTLGLVLAVAVNAQTESQTQQQPQEQHKQITLSSCLENMIQSKLDSDPQLRDSNVHVSVQENEVTLSGNVHSEDLRQNAVNIAKETAPGYIVADTIDVRPGEMAQSEQSQRPREMARADFDSQTARQMAEDRGDFIGQSEEDAYIYSQFYSKLSDSGLATEGMKISVENGTITLQGNVADQNAKNEAQQLAQQTEGVNNVKNELTTQGSQPAQ